MIIKSINEKKTVTIITCLVLLVSEIIIGRFVQETGIIEQDVFDVLFILVNVMAVMILIVYQKISYSFFFNIYIYSLISIGVAVFAYFKPDDFIGFIKQWDAYTFHLGAIAKMNGAAFWYEDTYTKFLALSYSCFGISYRIGVGINILASLTGIYFFYRTLKLLNLENRSIIAISTLYLIMPWRWELSLFPIREAIPACMLSVFLHYLVKWYLSASNKSALVAMVFAICSMMFHSGLIFVPILYMLFFIFYSPLCKGFVISLRSFRNFIFVFLIGGLLCGLFWDAIFAKMPTIDFILSNEAISGYSNYWNKDDGGSTYLTGLSYTSLLDVIIQSPLRAIYFALAPVPWTWRGVIDMISFIIGAGIHLLIYYYLLKNNKYIVDEYKPLFYMLLCIFVFEVFLYGATTFNSGTAMRHRAKFEVILFVIFAICMKHKIRI